MKTQVRSLLIGFVLLGSTAVSAQIVRPSLTTEDVLKWRAAHPERAEHFIPKLPAPPPPQQAAAQADAAFLAAEQDWNARLLEARERVRNFARRADESDLAATQLRNRVFHGDANALNANNARVAEAQNFAKASRAEARLAQETVNRLLDEGREAGYQIASLAPTRKDGSPNVEYYRARFLALQRDLQDAQAQAEVLQQRTNRLQTAINATLAVPVYASRRGILFYPNNGAADVFYVNRLRDELGGVGGDAQAAQARIALLTEQLQTLQEEGRRAGLPPGIFR